MTKDQARILLEWYEARVPPPWSVAPLKGKYYGTHVVDADGDEVAEFWSCEGEPSDREKAAFGQDWTPVLWADYCSDCHWESQVALAAALSFVELPELLRQLAQREQE